VILAYGVLTYEVEHRHLELEALTKEAEVTGGTVYGLKTVEDRITLVDDRRAALEELLPYDTPDDWVAVGSPAHVGSRPMRHGEELSAYPTRSRTPSMPSDSTVTRKP
jgi:hypothetical protein